MCEALNCTSSKIRYVHQGYFCNAHSISLQGIRKSLSKAKKANDTTRELELRRSEALIRKLDNAHKRRMIHLEILSYQTLTE